MTTMTEPTTRTLDAPRRRPSPTTSAQTELDRARAAADRLADGRRRVRAPWPSHFPDRTVVTYDPRGVERSAKADPATQSTPEQHADDLHRIIEALGGGPVDLFASSGGAVNALALVAAHPETSGRSSRTSHRSPSIVPDREGALAACARGRTRRTSAAGSAPAMAQFIARGEPPGPDHRRRTPPSPAPDPAMFGLPTEDDGTRTDPLLCQNIITCTHYEPDFDALRAAPTRIVIGGRRGVGGPAGPPRRRGRGRAARHRRPSSSRATTAASSAASTARRGDPDAFAAKLREVLAEA